ncbi:MAG: hypothetical protein J6X01_07285, partial [Bacteroidales bacterium]|nr:hypothetical protein [Bacteroidales bacterium]
LIKNLPQTLVNQKIICNFAPLYFQILLKGLAGSGSMAKKRLKIEVPKRINRITLCKIQYGNGVRADILHAGRSSTHMDNMKGTAEISSAYQKAISDYHSNMGKGNYADAGENLHTIADFYSHSNYIDMYLGYAEENGKSLNPKEIKTFSEMMEDKNFMNYVEKNGGLKTGEFTLKDYLKEKFGLQEPSPDSHTNVNLDKRTSKKGKEPYGNSTKYEAAKEAASKEINKIVNE